MRLREELLPGPTEGNPLSLVTPHMPRGQADRRGADLVTFPDAILTHSMPGRH